MLFPVTADISNESVMDDMMTNIMLFRKGLFRPKNTMMNHITSVSIIILPFGCMYIKITIGDISMSVMIKRRNSLYFSLYERVTDVVMITQSLAISDGCN